MEIIQLVAMVVLSFGALVVFRRVVNLAVFGCTAAASVIFIGGAVLLGVGVALF